MALKFEKTQEEFKDLLFASGIMGKWVNMVNKFRFRWDSGGSFDWLPKSGIIQFEGSSKANDRLKLLLVKILFNVAEIKSTPFLKRKTKIFVVCGEDKEAQEQLGQVLDELHMGNNFLASKNDEGLSIAQALEAQKKRKDDKVFGIVMLTADYHGTVKTNDIAKAGPMYGPELMLETGLLVAAMKLGQVVVLAKKGMTLPAKIPGVRHLNYENHIKEVKLAMVEQMQKSGLKLDVKKIQPEPKSKKTKKPHVKNSPDKSTNPNRVKTPPAFI